MRTLRNKKVNIIYYRIRIEYFNEYKINGIFYISVNKQINDKERIAAAMENPNLRELVEKCIQEEE